MANKKRAHNRVKNGRVRKVALDGYNTKMNEVGTDFGVAIAKKDVAAAEDALKIRDRLMRNALLELNRSDKDLLHIFPYKTSATQSFTPEQVQSAFSSAYLLYQKHQTETREQNDAILEASSPQDISDKSVVDLVTSQVSLARKTLMEEDKKKKIKWDDPNDPFWSTGDDSTYTRWAIVSKDPKVLKAIAKQGLVPSDEGTLKEEIDRLYEYLSIRGDIVKDPFIYPQPLLDTYIEYRIILHEISRSES